MATVMVPPPSVDVMLQMVKDDPKKLEAIKTSAEPLKELEKVANEAKVASAAKNKEFQAAFLSDKRIYRVAIYVLGALAIIAALGGLVLTVMGDSIPESVVALGSASVGALVGLFADKPTS